MARDRWLAGRCLPHGLGQQLNLKRPAMRASASDNANRFNLYVGARYDYYLGGAMTTRPGAMACITDRQAGGQAFFCRNTLRVFFPLRLGD